MAAGNQLDFATAGGAGSSGAGLQGSPLLGTSEGASHSPEESKPVKKPAKRGRKKKEDEVIPSDGEIDINTKRKIQNRSAQRAFRDRKEKHLADLEKRVTEQAEQLEVFRTLCDGLQAENAALRRGEDVPAGRLPPPPPPLGDLSQATPVIPISYANDVKPVLSPASLPFSAGLNLSPNSTAFTFIPPAPVSQQQPPPILPPNPASLPPIPTFPLAPSSLSTAVLSNETPLEAEVTNMDLNFDFDAPFDLSDALPLPPLFQNLFDYDQYAVPLEGDLNDAGAPMQGVSGMSTSQIADEDYGDEACPGDDDDPVPLGADKMPCPECDFSVVSCQLPLPWRPPTIGREIADKDVWQSQKAWAKLCSHPLFSQCDVNELCTALRDNTRCSADGRLVISKSDVCGVFRSIPARARVKREQEEMSR